MNWVLCWILLNQFWPYQKTLNSWLAMPLVLVIVFSELVASGLVEMAMQRGWLP